MSGFFKFHVLLALLTKTLAHKSAKTGQKFYNSTVVQLIVNYILTICTAESLREGTMLQIIVALHVSIAIETSLHQPRCTFGLSCLSFWIYVADKCAHEPKIGTQLTLGTNCSKTGLPSKFLCDLNQPGRLH